MAGVGGVGVRAALLRLVRVVGGAGVTPCLATVQRLPDQGDPSRLAEPDQVVDLLQHRAQLRAADLPQHRSQVGQGVLSSGQRVAPLTRTPNRLHSLNLDAVTDSPP
jgi:hypothetical protein